MDANSKIKSSYTHCGLGMPYQHDINSAQPKMVQSSRTGTLVEVLERARDLRERIQESGKQAANIADLLDGGMKTAVGHSHPVPKAVPVGLVEELINVLYAAERCLDTLGHALDRIDSAHG